MANHENAAPKWQRALPILTGVVFVVSLVAGLQWGRPILIPIATAALFTLLLSPVVQRLDQWGLHHVASVVITVTVTSIVLAILGWIIALQLTKMLGELPKNTETIRSKIRSLRQLGSGPTARQFGNMVDQISDELKAEPDPQDDTSDPTPDREKPTVETSPSPWSWVTDYLGSAAEVIGAFAFGGVLLVFFLLEGRELRDRLVVLAGKARLSVTSRALDDIADRITRYLGMVALVNGSFGLALSAILFLLGMPYAMLWGFVAAAFRFFPYVGPWVGAVFPITMSLALSDGWWQPLAVCGGVIVLELATNNLVEPFLFGRTTGVSPTALLICAAFWLYLWGPLGLVLSIPFAVCLVVIGKNVPELRFLPLLLSDEPALTADASYYHRLMLGESQEAIKVVSGYLAQPDSKNVYEELLIPTLKRAKNDLRQDRLEWDDYQSIIESMRGSLPEIDKLTSGDATTTDFTAGNRTATIVGLPAADVADQTALEILQRQPAAAEWTIRILVTDIITPELVAQITEAHPDLICIASIPPGGLRRARGLCKRLRAAFPDLPIVIGRWGEKRTSQNEREQLMLAGATAVTSTQAETCRVLRAKLATTRSLQEAGQIAN